METTELIGALAAIHRRAAGSDAERRAARLLAIELRRSGRRATRMHTFWVRPSWAPVHALLLAAGVAASVVAVDHPTVGLAIAGGALLALLLDLSGGVTPLRRLTFERATQNVVAPDPRGHEHAKVRVVLTAAVDVPGNGLLERGPIPRAGAAVRRALGGLWPGLHAFAILALGLVVAACAVRVAQDTPPSALGALQLVPTVVLVVLLGLMLDLATAEPSREGANADATAAAAVLAIAGELDRRPPRQLAVDVVLAGAGHAHALGMRRWVRNARREGLRAEQVVVLHVAPCGEGTPVWWTHEGLVVPLRYHPHLLRLAAAVADGERGLHARAVRGVTTSGARVARTRRWPAIAVGALPESGVLSRGGDDDTAEAVDADAVEDTIAFVLALVAALDEDLDRAAVAIDPPHVRRSAA